MNANIKFPNEDINYIAPSWDDMNQLAFQISKKMIQDGKKYDRIITLAKGGWPMTRPLVDFLEVKEVASIGVKFYSGINTKYDQPQIYQDIPVSVQGENVLLFDDVADSGESLQFVKKYLKEKNVASIDTATLYYKPHSVVKPNYWGEETIAWIVFPFEVVDTIHILGEKWQKTGLKQDEIKSRFLKLNFKKEWVEFYLNK